MARIAWIEDDQAGGELAELYEAARKASPAGQVADIYRTMSHSPAFLAGVMKAGEMHFSDGALTRAQHEMIASYVSALNRCHY